MAELSQTVPQAVRIVPQTGQGLAAGLTCVFVSAAMLTQRYFAGRTDGLRPGSEELLLATTGSRPLADRKTIARRGIEVMEPSSVLLPAAPLTAAVVPA